MKKIFLGWTKMPFERYVSTLTRLGGEVERNAPEFCDALVLPGGGDLNPRRYGQELCGAENIDNLRDEYELALFRYFFDRHCPILGICRGAQLINVALGGTLLQHIEGHNSFQGLDRYHRVQTDDPTLCGLYGESFQVNSAHHQAVGQLASCLQTTAIAEDGIIEAFRHRTLPVYALQWHPERMGEAGELLLLDFLKKLRSI